MYEPKTKISKYRNCAWRNTTNKLLNFHIQIVMSGALLPFLSLWQRSCVLRAFMRSIQEWHFLAQQKRWSQWRHFRPIYLFTRMESTEITEWVTCKRFTECGIPNPFLWLFYRFPRRGGLSLQFHCGCWLDVAMVSHLFSFTQTEMGKRRVRFNSRYFSPWFPYITRMTARKRDGYGVVTKWDFRLMLPLTDSSVVTCWSLRLKTKVSPLARQLMEYSPDYLNSLTSDDAAVLP